MCQLPVIEVKNPTPELLKFIEELDETGFYEGEFIQIS